MAKTALLRGLLASLGLCLAATSAHAWEVPPVKVDFKWQFDFKVTTPNTKKPQAPWYTYFPADPRMQTPQPIPYPTWPQQPPVSSQKQAPGPSTAIFPNWPAVARTQESAGTEVRSVGYVPQTAIPSYWYGNR